MEPSLILVDGYNVTWNTPGLSASGRAGPFASREALLAQVAVAYRPTPHRVVVVFDGGGPSERVEAMPRFVRGQVVYTADGVKADDTLVRLAAQARARGEQVKVVTEDAELRRRVEAQGAETYRPEQLSARLNQPSRDVAKRYQHRSAVRAQWERDADDEHTPREKKGNPRKAPKRRRGADDPGL